MGQHMEPQFPARDRTPAPCSGSWSLNRWPPGECPQERSLRGMQRAEGKEQLSRGAT